MPATLKSKQEIHQRKHTPAPCQNNVSVGIMYYVCVIIRQIRDLMN